MIEGAERADEAKYTIKVTNPVGEDTATLFVKVVGEWGKGLEELGRRLGRGVCGMGRRGVKKTRWQDGFGLHRMDVFPLLQMFQTLLKLCGSRQWGRTGPFWSGSPPSTMVASL